MDFSTMFGLLNPQGGDPFSLGAILQNPEKAAEVLGGAGVPPPPQGQGFADWIKGLAPELPPMGAAPFAGLGFPGTPAVDPTKVPTVPFGQSNLGQTFGARGAPETPPPPGLPGAGMGGTQTRATTPDILAPINQNPPLPSPRPKFLGLGGLASDEGVTTGPTLAQAGKAPETGTPPGVKQVAGGIKEAISGLKTPPLPEQYIPKAGTPQLPHVSALPRDITAQILAQLTGRQQNPQILRLAQALGGLRG